MFAHPARCRTERESLAGWTSHRWPGSPRRRTRRRYRATVRSEMVKPSFRSSPCIFGAPQVGFSSATRRINVRISAVVAGRPPPARDRHFQKSRNPARCQPTTVSGFTTIRTSVHRDQTRRNVVQNNRSHGFKRGRGRFRLRTATCCRSARISRAVSCRLRKKTRTAERRARMNWDTNLRL